MITYTLLKENLKTLNQSLELRGALIRYELSRVDSCYTLHCPLIPLSGYSVISGSAEAINMVIVGITLHLFYQSVIGL